MAISPTQHCLQIWLSKWKQNNPLLSESSEENPLRPVYVEIFMRSLDDAFRLVVKNTDSSDSAVDKFINQSARNYLVARQSLEQVQEPYKALALASTFRVFYPLMQHYSKFNLDPSVLEKLAGHLSSPEAGDESEVIGKLFCHELIPAPKLDQVCKDLYTVISSDLSETIKIGFSNQLDRRAKSVVDSQHEKYLNANDLEYIDNLARFADLKPSKRALQAYDTYSAYCRNQSHDLKKMTKVFTSLAGEPDEIFDKIDDLARGMNLNEYQQREAFLLFLENYNLLGFPNCEKLSSCLPAIEHQHSQDCSADFIKAAIGLYELGDKKLFSSFMKNAQVFSEQSLDLSLLGNLYLEIAQYDGIDSSTVLENYSQALEQGIFHNSTEACGNLGDIVISLEVINRSRGEPGSKLTTLRVDQHPWSKMNPDNIPINQAELSNAFSQSMDTLKRALDRHKSSVADAFACRGIKEGVEPFYEQFIQWLLPVNFSYIKNQGWKDHSFPGNGWYFDNLGLSEKVKDYVAKVTAWQPIKLGETPLSEDETFTRSRNIIDAFSNSEIYRLRGVTIVSPEKSNKDYHLISSHGKEPYSFLFYNDHYANPTNTKALLIPTRYLEENASDINKFKTNLSPERLRLHPDVLDLGSMSIFGGGLCNARRARSAPFLSWQRGANYPDINGHPHKYNIRNRENILRVLQEDHQNVYDVSSRFLTMMYQMDLLESMYTKGLENKSFTDDDNLHFDPSRVLETYDLWTERYADKPEANPDFSAVLVDCDTFGKANIPDWTIKLDPVANKYSIKDEDGSIATYPLSDDNEARSRLLLSRMKDPERTLRFYPKYLAA